MSENVGKPLIELVKDVQEGRPKIVGARVNNKLKELDYVLKENDSFEFVDLSNVDGARIYQRSVVFLFIKAVNDIFKTDVIVKHSLSKGLYCEFENNESITTKDMIKIELRMREIIENDEPFIKNMIPKEEAYEFFNKNNLGSKSGLLKYRDESYINLYSCCGFYNYFYGYMVPSTRFIDLFELIYYKPGVIIRFPNENSPYEIPTFEEQSLIHTVHDEAEKWGEILKVSYVSNLNDMIENNQIGKIIRANEALHEKKISQIADMIVESKKRVILIAGPSSSGKTTFANRLKVQLNVSGLDPITISTDDYFVDREFTPKDENGDYDFESIDAVDITLFNEQLKMLLEGQKVELPTFNFKIGKKEYLGNYLKINEDQPIIIEGIHGLNDKLTKDIFRKDKFKIYISALTQLNIDQHNRVPTTDTRIIRRMVRDNNFRGHSPLKTIQMWRSVRRGEERNIFPYQESADVVFNSSLVYELSTLKKHILPQLLEIPNDIPEYQEALRLIKFLNYFNSIEDDNMIPNTSILKEFIGGSCFY
jgi:uridine kinase